MHGMDFMRLAARALTVTPRLARRALSTSLKAGSYVSKGSRKPGSSSVISTANASWYLDSLPI